MDRKRYGKVLMRLKKYINEIKKFHSLDVINSIADKLVKNCEKSFLKEVVRSNNFLYRGTYNSIDVIEVFTPRKDRRPTDTGKEAQKVLDQIFFDEFGWHPRSQGVFVSGDALEASGYGSYSYLFFPIGKYKFIWSKKYKDLYTDYSKNYLGTLYIDDDLIKSYFDKDLYSAIKSENEIMFGVSKYYLVNIVDRIEERDLMGALKNRI